MDALSGFSARKTPQSEQASPRQKKNNAGGYSFETTDLAKLHRFLTLGTEGGTFYVKERALTKANAEFLMTLARAGDMRLITETADISLTGRAPRNNPALFALAVASGLTEDTSAAYRSAALAALPAVARTGSHLLTWASYIENFRGWGPQLTKAVGDWYNRKSLEDVAYQVLKYQQRGGWSQRDLLRLAHFGRKVIEPERMRLYRAVMNLPYDGSLPHPFAAVDAAHSTSDVHKWVSLIEQNYSLSWEMLPSQALAEARVWTALVESGNLPLGALLRNLGRITSLGVVSHLGGSITAEVAQKLADPAGLARARIHPMAILVAMKTYAQGHGVKGKLTWDPSAKVSDALDAGFYASFPSVKPCGLPMVVAVDVSGSMGWGAISGLPLTPREAACALALVTMASEPDATIMAFSHELVPVDISPRMRLDNVIRKMASIPMGGTDCSLPMQVMEREKIPVNLFQVLTDCETWAGSVHPHQALEQYRQEMGIAARLAVVGMTATDITIADPLDPGSLDVAGFDASVPKMLADFGRGEL